ncbi:DNA ligase [Undibacterium flavidum]|uniref:DNA ligase n=1 Tax=Undibacterium flavidum TaxID=2762297 RepID=A0ABR6YCM4_9BURK|nr:DNA ligase [Undibacterium flavidum]MBC3874302.1 DNA ligase [Undibacterium flavidum]
MKKIKNDSLMEFRNELRSEFGNEFSSEPTTELSQDLNNRGKARRQILFYSLLPLNFLALSVSAKSFIAAERSAARPADFSIAEPDNHLGLALVLPLALRDASQLLSSNLTDYLMSEKLDGVRAYWDGKKLYFRSGRVINAPAWFTEKFPTHPMDGELWMGRAQFERLSGAVRRQQANDQEWRQIQYCLFEYPLAKGEFRQRLQDLQNTVDKLHIPWLRIIPQESVKSVEQIEAKLKQLSLQKAEGLVLHLASAEFQAGRSEFVYKLKPQHDAEAKVIAIQAGQGKYQGMMGALLLETSEGKRFKLGTGFDDEQRRNPPQVGSLITYRYRDWTASGLPKFASFVRVYRPE